MPHEHIAQQSPWEGIADGALAHKIAQDQAWLLELRNRAEQAGREPYDVDAVMTLYYPNSLDTDELGVRRNVRALETLYLLSTFTTLEEWARYMYQIEAQSDT